MACLDRDIAGTGTGGGLYECQRADLVANPTFSHGSRSPSGWFNVNAFVVPQLSTFGNSQKNNVRLPGINNWDLSLVKNFEVPWFGRHRGWLADEKANLQFRAEFFNAWNRTQFNGVDTTLVASNGPGSTSADIGQGFGQVNSARPPREIQFGLKLTF